MQRQWFLFCTLEDSIYDMVLQLVDLENLAIDFIRNDFNDATEFFELMIDKYSKVSDDRVRQKISAI